MCGIIAVLSRRTDRRAPTTAEITALIDTATASVTSDPAAAAASLSALDDLLRGVAGIIALTSDEGLARSISAALRELAPRISELEAEVEVGTRDDESVIALQDASWAISRDRLRTAEAVRALADGAPVESYNGYLSIQRALSALDRLEVRGRDSAGIQVMVSNHDLSINDPVVAAQLTERSQDDLFRSSSVRETQTENGSVLSFVYKAAAEIGELGDNTAVIREAVRSDSLLRAALSCSRSQVVVLGHTRWASIGVISEANAHPLNSEELDAETRPYVVGVLNGDVDNHADLTRRFGLQIHHQITTDAKVIPTLTSRQMGEGLDPREAFRRAVNEFEGSVAIGALAADRPSELMLALRGSGQGVYIGFADDGYIVASEPYGVVEETNRYLRLDGESGGEIVVVDLNGVDLDGLERYAYSGAALPISADEIVTAEVTTRDIDRGDAPHYLLKEIEESPRSFQRTLRGRLRGEPGSLEVVLPEASVPNVVRERLASRQISRVQVIGQGTAAVAGQGVAAMLHDLCGGELDVDAITATEVSGFQLRSDMSDTLIIAVSQSGTTTDTNRTVDLLRARGALVIAIVNRRGSDLAVKADGVVYTSDGRDVEMSVASTKAFYAQVAAGALLACDIAASAGVGSASRRSQLLTSLQELPSAMANVLSRRSVIAEIATRSAPSKRYWAVVGNGPNLVAANEVRIKLSELCYKSIAADVTEDKKHIDLSSEPLIFICAAGLSGSNADDVAKETAIFSAHKATPIIVCDEGQTRFTSGSVIEVPPVDPALGFILSAMVGHLFGYEAARAIDRSALPLRAARDVIERSIESGNSADEIVATIADGIQDYLQEFEQGVRAKSYDGHLEASTAVRLTAAIGFLRSRRPVEDFSIVTGNVGTPELVISEVVDALSAAIDELTRPIDAIKHQAKTVTVGISRSDSDLVDAALVQAVMTRGAGRDVVSYRSLKVLAALDGAVAAVTGATRYSIVGDVMSVLDRDGVAVDLPSRVDRDPALNGTKRYVAEQKEVLVARGRRDGRTVILVPETKAGVCNGITLLHVEFHDYISVDDARTCLQGYDNRYERLVDWVTETEGSFDESKLGEISVADLLISPISEAANHWVS